MNSPTSFPSFPGPLAIVITLLLAIYVLHNTFVPIVSCILNIYLHWRYPIREANTRKTIPSTPYRFPNGNGDVDKFILGPKKTEEWRSRYGAIYRIWNGMKPELVVSTPTAIQAIFKDSDQHSKAENMGSGYLMSRILGQCVGLLNGQSWRQLRRKFDPPFMHQGATRLIPKMLVMTESHLERVFTDPSAKEGKLDPVADFLLLPFLMIAVVIYGDLCDSQISWLQKWSPKREKLFAYALMGGLPRFSFSKWLPTEANKCMAEWEEVWGKFNDDAYNGSKKHGQDTLLVRLYEDPDIPKDQVLQTIDESLYANLDVGIGSVSWNLVFLACYPDVQARLYQEICQETSEGWEKYIQRSDTFLEACICESIRLRPIAAFAVPQSAPTDRIADGYVIPAGTNVTVDIYTLNQKNPFWGADPLSYRPSRWKGLKPSQIRYNFSRFGFGPRQCMGKYMALPMVRIIVAKTIIAFDLRLDGGYEQVIKNSRGLGTHPNVELAYSRR
ncbi:cytochrome P450 [Corynespora cassiicola Philippines]|uniref:Cytochrome P450 n=1 Tax=Corynespora cassiicola Philippines TaxID=1448308 RepID=A0A2T2NAE5_CORCC|nr:cytochrome P450 [Corynespora cassiicola Philippines]